MHTLRVAGNEFFICQMPSDIQAMVNRSICSDATFVFHWNRRNARCIGLPLWHNYMEFLVRNWLKKFFVSLIIVLLVNEIPLTMRSHTNWLCFLFCHFVCYNFFFLLSFLWLFRTNILLAFTEQIQYCENGKAKNNEHKWTEKENNNEKRLQTKRRQKLWQKKKEQ